MAKISEVSEQTRAEMARGLMRVFMATINESGDLVPGIKAIRSEILPGGREVAITVQVRDQEVVIVDDWKNFPSEKLLAQLALIA